MEEEYKSHTWIAIIIIVVFMISILIWYNNYLWVQGNCYNTLINASSGIIERCNENGVFI